MRAFNYFDHSYLVNLPESKTRYKSAIKELKKYKISAETIYAVPPHPNIFDYEKSKSVLDGYQPRGTIGCNLSHLKIYADALKKGYEKILIFEDDFAFFKGADKKFADGIRHLPDDWDLVYLGGQPVDPLENVNDYFVKVGHFWGTWAYGVNCKALPTLINKIIDNISLWATDGIISKLSPELNKYCFYPPIIYHKDGYSFIMDCECNWWESGKDKWLKNKPPNANVDEEFLK